MLQGEYNKKF